MKTKTLLFITVLLLAFFTISCNKLNDLNGEGNNNPFSETITIEDNKSSGIETKNIWKCTIFKDITITLTISGKNVYVNKSPQEDGYYDQFHQFRDGTQYVLSTEAPSGYIVLEGGLYLVPFESDCPTCSFSITNLSEDEMKLEYMGPLFGVVIDGITNINNYLFHKITVE